VVPEGGDTGYCESAVQPRRDVRQRPGDVVAYALFNLVAASGDNKASKWKRVVATQMTRDAINKAQSLSSRMAANPSRIGAIIDHYVRQGQ
jgi:hypothetical protein